jgi:DNA mismatch repair protein MutS
MVQKKESITEVYLNYKKKYQKIIDGDCIVLLESGHFMELYGTREDEDHFEICRNILNIMVTRRDKDPESAQFGQYMAGIPTHSIKRYYKILLKHNYTVVCVEQITPAPNPQRAVTKILSPGCSLSEDVYNSSENGESIMVSLLIDIDEDNDIYIDLCTFDTNLGISKIQTIISDNNEDILYSCFENLILIDYNEIMITIINENKNIDKNNCIHDILNKLRLKNKMKHIKYYDNKEKSEIYGYFNLNYQTTFLETVFSNYKNMYTSIQETLDISKQAPSLICNYIILLNFVSLHDNNLIKNLPKPNIISFSDNNYLKSFNNTYQKLNIFSNGENNKNSLFYYINNTSCKSTQRELIERIKKPLLNIDEINRRYDYLDEMLKEPNNISIIEKNLKIHDLQRIYRRFSILRLNPYEIPRIEFSNNQILDLIKNVKECEHFIKIKNELLPSENEIELFKEYSNEIINIFDIEKCSKVNLQSIAGTLFNKNIFLDIDSIVDEIITYEKIIELISNKLSFFIFLNDEKNNKKCYLHNYSEELYKKQDNINNKFKHYVSPKDNDKEGYWLDVTKTRGEKLKKSIENNNYPILEFNVNGKNMLFKTKDIDWNTKNKTNMKLCSKQIKDLSNKITILKGNLQKLSKEKYLIEIERLYKKYYFNSIEKISTFITNIDLIKSNAKTAHLYRYTRPNIYNGNNDNNDNNDNDESFIDIKEIRHPIIEQIIKLDGKKYVANSINIDKNNSYLVYGVNSVGKSSLLKSIALAVIMAQSGLFVPAKEMNFAIYKKIFSRMGNDDNIFKNHSSFVKEMIESKEIINKSDKNSLVIADELCASTEMESAIKIVSSIIKVLSDNKSSFIFATHIFKLSEINLIKNLKNICFKHLKVRFEDELIFERVLTDGLPENRQYGAIVAKKIIQNDIFNTILNNESYYTEEEPNLNQIMNQKISNYNNKLILEKCKVCNYKPTKPNDIPLETHHINMQCETDSYGYHDIYHKNELHNLVGLCKTCHQKVHNDEIIINDYIETENGLSLDWKYKETEIEPKINNEITTYTENNDNIGNITIEEEGTKTIKSKKKKKKYDEEMINSIKEYYEINKYKTKSIILHELRKNEKIKNLSIKVFNQIIDEIY